MQVRRIHWLIACTVAIVLHAVLLIGLRSRTVGEALPPQGPIIEIATSLPGVVGSVVEEIEVNIPDKIEESDEPNKTAITKPDEPEVKELEPTVPEPVVQKTEPTPPEPVIQEPKPKPPEPVEQEPEPTPPEPVVQVP